jgi:hypothetical protein
MPDLGITFSISDSFYSQARAFVDFLRRAARKHSVEVSTSTKGIGEFEFWVPERDLEKFDLILQELIFNNGLYYYLLGASNRRAVAKSVVGPTFQTILDSRFRVTYPSLLRRHILYGPPGWILAGEFAELVSQRFEILFRRFKVKLISGYEFIRDLDDLLTEFMLQQLDYPGVYEVQDSIFWLRNVAAGKFFAIRRFVSSSTMFII